MLSLSGLNLFAQCPPGPLGTGQFLDKPFGCATNGLDIEFTPQYSQLDDNAVIRIDWGDGTPLETINLPSTGSQSGITYNTAVPHTYTEAATTGACIYEITAWVESGCYTEEETTVSAEIAIFNTDDYGDGATDISIDPMLLEVCAGTEVEVSFRDVSPWNCTDAATLSTLNNRPRWTRWIHGVSNSISGDPVLINGNPEGFPFPEPVMDHLALPVLNPQGPGNESMTITVPATAQVGEEFHVRLENWNQCNPYDDGSGVPPVNPPVTQTAIIRVIAPPDPAVNTVTAGPFCVGEEVQFSYDGTAQAGYTYLWDFGDGETSSDMNPTHVYESDGIFDVTVTVDNTSISVSCEAVTNPAFQVTITPTPVPVISVEDENGNPVSPDFCEVQGGQFVYFNMDPASVTPNPGNTQFTWNFYEKDDNGTIQTTFVDPASLPIQHFFPEPGVYRVALIADDLLTNCGFTTIQDITIYDNPVSSYTVTEVCEGERTAFANISDLLPVSVNGDQVEFWDWDFSYDGVSFNQELRQVDNTDFEWFLDGSPVAGETEPATSAAGTYTVALRLTTQVGQCTHIFSDAVEVKPLPVATLSSTYTSPVCLNEEVTFTNESVQPPAINLAGPLDYQLVVTDLDDNSVVVVNFLGTYLSYIFTNSGSTQKDYEVKLVANAFNGCTTESTPLVVTVNPGFSSGFSDIYYDPLMPNCSPRSGTFEVNEATRNLNADTYTWTIEGEEGVLEGFPVTKLNGSSDFHFLNYTLSNDLRRNVLYRVRLEAEKANVCISGSQQLIRIDPVPLGTFSITQALDSCNRKTLVFDADEKGLIEYKWSHDVTPDEVVDEGARLTFVFDRPEAALPDISGMVTLETINTAGCGSVPEQLAFSVENKNAPVTVDFTAQPEYQLLPGSEVQIQNLTSGGENLQYLWRFGDGTTSTDANPGLHSYESAGTYTISLEVLNGYCSESFERTITIEPSTPEIDFVPDRYSGCRPLTVQFENISQFADTTTFLWDFGDGQGFSSQVNPRYTYSEPGIYSVSLKGRNAIGVEDVEVKEAIIEVYEVPIAAFDLRPTEVYLPDKPVFFSNLSVGADSLFWDFGDGNTSTELNPTHYYQEVGNFMVTLVARTNIGCADTVRMESAVRTIEGGRVVVPNAFTPSAAGPGGGGGGETGSFNDVFLPRTEGVTGFRMLIYNKWGQMVYESTNANTGWDGYYKGRICPQDVYVYRLELTYINGQKQVKVGDVTLIR